ncbi:MAG: hypothetical protein K0M63_09475 [Weeksellaceae bacterium]|nr:hypothetical protein [Weeksellaceae bacterium]
MDVFFRAKIREAGSWELEAGFCVGLDMERAGDYRYGGVSGADLFLILFQYRGKYVMHFPACY